MKISWFKIPEKSKWIDVGMYDCNGHYKLVQMRYRIDNNEKELRTVSLGFVNDWKSREKLFSGILSHNSGDSCHCCTDSKWSLYKQVVSLKEKCKKLEFMIENGLGWEDLRNDITLPNEI